MDPLLWNLEDQSLSSLDVTVLKVRRKHLEGSQGLPQMGRPWQGFLVETSSFSLYRLRGDAVERLPSTAQLPALLLSTI